MALAEIYQNRFTNPPNQECRRYWVHPKILVGGNVNPFPATHDYNHLKNDLGIQAFINLDHNISSDDSEYILNNPVHDNGEGFAAEDVRRVVSFAYQFKDHPIYVNCHIGYSRSPAFAYAIMRWVYHLTQFEAFKLLDNSGGPFGSDYLAVQAKHTTYIRSIEAAFPG